MSNGLNGQFIANPIQFMTNYNGINSSNIRFLGPGGANYNLDHLNVGRFDLLAANHNTVELRNYEGNAFPYFVDPPIRAYYLSALTDQTRAMPIANHANYLFTDTITGCSFKAYGHDRNHLLVEHQNALNRPRNYAEQRLRVTDLRYQVTIVYDSTDYRSVGFNQGEDPGNTIVTIIGWRRNDGWHFYARRMLGQPGGVHRTLDAAPFEI